MILEEPVLYLLCVLVVLIVIPVVIWGAHMSMTITKRDYESYQSIDLILNQYQEYLDNQTAWYKLRRRSSASFFEKNWKNIVVVHGVFVIKNGQIEFFHVKDNSIIDKQEQSFKDLKLSWVGFRLGRGWDNWFRIEFPNETYYFTCSEGFNTKKYYKEICGFLSNQK